jgi:hypothetical protein
LNLLALGPFWLCAGLSTVIRLHDVSANSLMRHKF